MEAYWKSPWESEHFGVANVWPDFDVLQYAQKWDSTGYARAMLYGLLTMCAIGNLSSFCHTVEIWANMFLQFHCSTLSGSPSRMICETL